MKKLDWKEMGQFLSVLLGMFTVIRDSFQKMGIGLEIIPWLIGEGRKIFAEKFLKQLGKQFLEASGDPSTKIWKTIDSIDFKNGDNFREILRNAGSYCSLDAVEMLEDVVFPEDVENIKLDLVLVKVRDFGFTDRPASKEDVFNRAFARGLEKCPAWMGPQLRMVHRDEDPFGIFVAMDDMVVGKFKAVFILLSSSLDLGAETVGPRGLAPDHYWVFIKPRN